MISCVRLLEEKKTFLRTSLRQTVISDVMRIFLAVTEHFHQIWNAASKIKNDANYLIIFVIDSLLVSS